MFALAPLVALLLIAEGFARFVVFVQPSVQTLPLAPGAPRQYVPHPELFWALRPNLDSTVKSTVWTVRIRTNSLGLRGPEIEPRAEGELRILSIGESSTFGEGVEENETYTDRLGALFRDTEGGDRKVVAINAGVPAYSSFQGRRFLERTGLSLDPDLLLVYFELNDHLPSSLRDAGQSEVGLPYTDAELDARSTSRWSRTLSSSSALYRLVSLWFARRQIASFDGTRFHNPLLDIGMPDIGLPPRLESSDPTLDLRRGGREVFLARRVSEAERRENLEAFAQIAQREGIELVLIHPSYRHSRPHECLLTQFAAERGVHLFEAHPALHEEDRPRGTLFIDFWHPTAEGHARLAQGLFDFIRERELDGSRR